MGTRQSKRRRSLSDALFSKTQQRVLGLVFGHPDRSFFAREIIARAGGGTGAVQRELSRLVDSGLVTVRSIGNQRHYQANRDSPVFTELRGLITKTIGVAEPLRAALAPLSDRIDLALLYGSVAKGEDRADSDIDLLVVANDVTLEELFERLAPLEKKLERRVNPTLYKPAEFRRRRESRNPFVVKVLAGETILLIGNEDAARAAG